MARPTKQGIDYFPLDCQFDDKVEMYLLETGAVGFAVLVSIWQMIYSNEGYFILDNNDLRLLIKRKIDVGINEVNDCINVCLRRNLFNADMQNEYKILTSSAIQHRYFDAAKKKKTVKVIHNYLLVPVDSYRNLVNSDVNTVNVDGNATNVKVKEEVNVKEEVESRGGGVVRLIDVFKPSDETLGFLKTRNQKTPTDSDVIAFVSHYDKKPFNDDREIQVAFRKWMAQQTMFDESNGNKGGGGIKFPARNDQNAWKALASEHGVKTKPGESQYEFEQRVTRLVTEKLAA